MMIGRLRGSLEAKKPPLLLIEVAGVGYEVLAPMSTIYQLPGLHESVVLFTHLHVREDAHILYGFYEERERALFRALIKVSGVGPKMALGILSGIEINTFIQCVERREINPLIRLPGVGKKTAERLVIEMKDKLKNSFEETSEFSDKNLPLSSQMSNFAEEEAISALIALGYKPQEASRAVLNVEGESLSSQELIRRALQAHGKKETSV